MAQLNDTMVQGDLRVTGSIYGNISGNAATASAAQAGSALEAAINSKSTLALGETSSTAYRGDRGKTAYDHSQATHAPTTSSAAASGGTTLSLVTTGEKYTWNNKSTLALGETSSTAYRGDRGKTAYDHSQATHAPTTSKTAASGGTDLSLVTTGEKYTWNNKSNLVIGTTSSTAAAGNHTHTTSLAADSGTATVSLDANTTYKLTAGGKSVIFKTPADTNTWRGIQNNLASDSTTESLSAAQGKALANGSARDSTKVPITNVSLEGQTTTILAQVQSMASSTIHYKRFFTNSDGGSASISDKPVSGSAGFICEVVCNRYVSASDWRYQLTCWVQADTNPYVAIVTNGSTSITWSRLSTNTDTKVTQTADDSSTSTAFEVLFSSTADNTTRAEASRKSSKLTFQPSTGTLTATKFSGPLTGNVTGDCSGSSGSCTGNAASASSVNATTGNSITSTGSNGSMEILNGALSSASGGGGSCSIDGDGISFTQGVSGTSMTAASIATSGTGTFTEGASAKGRPIDGSATIVTKSSLIWNSATAHLVINRSAGSTTVIDLKSLTNNVVYWLHVPIDNIIALKNSSTISTFYCYDASFTTNNTTDTYDIRSRNHGGFSTAIVRNNTKFYVMMDY